MVRERVNERHQRLEEMIGETPAVRFATATEQGEAARGAGALIGHVPLADLLASLRGRQVEPA